MVGRRLIIIALVAIAAIIAAACSGGAAATASPSAAASASPSAAASASPSEAASPSAAETEEPSPSASEAAGEDYKVEVANGSVGSFLTGEDGMTLYIFKNDTKDSGKSTCNGGCADNWPPFVLDGDDAVEAGTGVGGTFAKITRDDGATQVSYNGMPLYYFKNDTAPGDTKGQGLNEVWFVATP